MSQVRLYQGDCLEGMRNLADNSAHLAFIDLPYGLGIAGWDNQLSGTEAIDICRTKLVEGGSIYATCTAHILPIMLGLMNVRRIIAWGKPNLPLRQNLNEWEWSTEYVLWETKGAPRVFNKPHGEDGRDYWRIAVENGFLNRDGHKHPARKPVALLQRIIEASTQLGDTVIDPFMGSGTTAIACIESGRNFIGYEIDPIYYGMSQARVTEAQIQIPMFEVSL